MSARRWLWAALGYLVFVTIGGVALALYLRLDLAQEPRGPSILSAWRGGRRVARHVTQDPSSPPPGLADETATLVVERIIDEGPVITFHPRVFALSFVAGRDGIRATYGGRDAYLTADDLLAHQLYDPGATSAVKQLRRGIDVERALELLARELGCNAAELYRSGRFRRFVARRDVLRRPDSGVPARGDTRVTADNLERSARRLANFLARHLDADGNFRYEIDATTGELRPGYSWPRHGGATLFLAEAAGFFRDRRLSRAARRAAARLRDATTLRCGPHACIGEGDVVNVGSSALAALGYAELVASKIDASFRKPLRELSAFLRSQQRPDGEFMHLFDRPSGRAIDEQLPFFSGEAVLALARAHRVTGDPADLQAAKKGLRYLTGERWRFFGSRYYFDAEHWTCQAVDELWDRAPDPDALAFCLRWTAYNRYFQFGSTPIGDYDGGFAQVPFFPPRLTPAASRSEGAAGTLAAARRALRSAPGLASAGEIAALEDQISRALGFLLRYELPAGREHLLADPKAARGGIPGSPVDLTLRIDFQQHAGSAMLRFARSLRERESQRSAKRAEL